MDWWEQKEMVTTVTSPPLSPIPPSPSSNYWSDRGWNDNWVEWLLTLQGRYAPVLSRDAAGRYMCQICNKPFKTSSNLTEHHKIYHLGIFRYHCSICHRGYSHKCKLQAHMKRCFPTSNPPHASSTGQPSGQPTSRASGQPAAHPDDIEPVPWSPPALYGSP